jgi:hypothetical protein
MFEKLTPILALNVRSISTAGCYIKQCAAILPQQTPSFAPHDTDLLPH